MALTSAKMYLYSDRGGGTARQHSYAVHDALEIFAGSLVGLDTATGTLKLWSGATGTVLRFKGIALQTKTGDSTPAAGFVRPETSVEEGGLILHQVTVAGVTAITDVGDDVYASDENTFTKTAPATGGPIARIQRWYSGTTCDIQLFTPEEYLPAQ